MDAELVNVDFLIIWMRQLVGRSRLSDWILIHISVWMAEWKGMRFMK